MVWRALLQNWLQQQARAKVYEHLTEAARQRAAGQTPTDEPPAEPARCHVGLVFALGIELGGLEDLLGGLLVTRGPHYTVRQGRLRGRAIAVIETGMGSEAAAHGTEVLLAGHRPDWVISAGFAGGLRDDLRRGDILMADGIVSPAGQKLAVDLKVDPASLRRTPGVHVGRLASIDRILAGPDEKRAWGARFDALAVDMESWAVAEVCRQSQTRFLSVRVISDAVEDALPEDVTGLAKQPTVAGQLGAVTSALWRRPSSFKDMWRLKENAMICSDRLARFLADTVERWCPQERTWRAARRRVDAMLNLRSTTDPRWLSRVNENLEEVLLDHARCEKKAAAVAMNLIVAYVEHVELVRELSAIVAEELDHFRQVLDRIEARGIRFRRIKPGNYGQQLHALVRAQEPGRAVDRLLVAGLIEARSCERFALLKTGIGDPDLAAFYGSLFESEARHHATYVKLACLFASEEAVHERLSDLSEREAEIIAQGNESPRMHS